MEKPRMLKRNLESAKTINRPVLIKEENVKSNSIVDIETSNNSIDNMVASCAVELMNARDTFHKLHLKVTGNGSYAAHKALNELYEQLPDFIDTLVEGYQGVTEKILVCKEIASRTVNDLSDGIDYLRELYAMINKLQTKLPYSEIVNNLDLVKDAINSTKYKLLFLK
jgi:hypothetical protein